MTLKLLFDPESGKVLGAQAVGGDGVDKRIDVLAVAIQAGMTVFDLEEVELAYAPQYGSAKDPVNMAGFVAAGLLRGDHPQTSPEELLAAAGASRCDTFCPRCPHATRVCRRSRPRAVNVPVDELRGDWVSCREGGRSRPTARSGSAVTWRAAPAASRLRRIEPRRRYRTYDVLARTAKY
jgi:hypothetical protein